MGLLDSSLINNLPAVNGVNSATTPSWTNSQTITLSNPGGYRGLIIVFTLTGGDWGGSTGTKIQNIYSSSPIMTKLDGCAIKYIDDGYYVFVDAAGQDVRLYATSSDGQSKTLSYSYMWVCFEPFSFDEKKNQLLMKSSHTLATGTTTYNFANIDGTANIDVSRFKYLYVAVFCKLNDTAQNTTCVIRRSRAFTDFDGTTRAKTDDLLSMSNESIAISEWEEVRSQFVQYSAKFESANVVNGAKLTLLVYGIR